VPQCRSKLVKMLSEYQKAWIWTRRRVTWRLIQIQDVCIIMVHWSCLPGRGLKKLSAWF